MGRNQALGLLGWLLLCFLVSAVGAIASISASSFYRELTQPQWAPPAWLFGPVWSTLYTLMAISAWLVWRQGGWRVHGHALGLFLVQLGFNAIWSWVFFAWKLGFWALVDITILWGLIVATLIRFWAVSRAAGALLVPYMVWVGFAWGLNFALWRLNPEVLG